MFRTELGSARLHSGFQGNKELIKEPSNTLMLGQYIDGQTWEKGGVCWLFSKQASYNFRAHKIGKRRFLHSP